MYSIYMIGSIFLKYSHKRDHLPSAITSYDLLKTLAIIFMIIDHIGYFFFPDEIWFRVIGRLSVPIWFFLIGFARTREVPKIFLIGGVVVSLSALVSGEYLLPINILFTLAFARFAVDWLFSHAMRNRESFMGMFSLLFLMGFPTLVFSEYGVYLLVYTLFGAIVRNRENIQAPKWFINSFIIAAALGYLFNQGILLPSLSLHQLLVFTAGMAILSVIFASFRPRIFESWQPSSFPPLKIIQFTGRYTLEIYVVHLLILRIIAMIFESDRFIPFHFKIFAFPHVQAFFY